MSLRKLDFEVNLDLTKFNSEIKQAEKAAKEFNTNMSNILDLKRQINKANSDLAISESKVKKAQEEVKKAVLETKKAKEDVRKQTAEAERAIQKAREAEEKAALAAVKTRQAMEGQTNAARMTNTALLRTSETMRELSRLAGTTFSIAMISRLVSSVVQMTGQFEVQKMSLRTILQDVAAADKIFQDLYEFSSKSTYRFSELAQHAKQLAGFGIDKNSLLETTKMLGDVASGLGVSIDRIILAYGHVKSSGFLRGIQLRSFSQNGVPLLDELAKMLTKIEGKAVSLGDVFDKMTKREISFEMVEQAFKNMTSEGGKFYKMQETLAETVAGKINILKGKWENALGMAGMNQMSGKFKFVIDALNAILDNVQFIGLAVKEVVYYAGVYGFALIAKALGSIIGNFGMMIRAVRGSTAAMKALNMSGAAALGWLTVAASLAVELGKAIYRAFKGHDTSAAVASFNEEIAKLTEDIKEQSFAAIEGEIRRIKQLQDTINDTTLSYRVQKEALDALNGIVENYNGELDREGKLIKGNNEAIEDYIKLLNARAQASANEKILTALYQKRSEIQLQKQLAQKKRQIMYERYDDQNAVVAFLEAGLNQLGFEFAGSDWNNLEDADNALKDIEATEQALDSIIVEYEKTGAKAKDAADAAAEALEETSAWRRAVKNVFAEQRFAGVNTLNQLKDTTSAIDWVKNVLAAEKEAIDEIHMLPEELKGPAKKELELIRALQDAVPSIDWAHLSSSGHYKPDTGGLTDAEKKEKDAFDAHITNIKTYLSEFKQLINEGMSEAEAAKKVAEMNPLADPGEMADSLDGYYALLTEALQIMDAQKKLYDQQDVASLASYISHQQADDEKTIRKNTKNLEKALSEYDNTVKEWLSQDYNVGGEGVGVDISKVITAFNNTVTNIQKKAVDTSMAPILKIEKSIEKQEAARKVLADRTMSDEEKIIQLRLLGINYIKEERLKEISEATDAEIAAQKFLAQQKIDSFASKFLTDAYKNKSIDPTNLGGATLGQLRRYRQELANIFDDVQKNGIPVTEEMQKAFDSGEFSLEKLIELIKEGLTKAQDNVDKKWWQDIAKLGKFAAKQVQELAKSLGELGEAGGYENLVEIANAVEHISNGISNIAQGFSTGSWIGAAIAAVATIATEIINLATAEEQAKNKAEELQEALRVLSMDRALSEGVESIFGKNGLKSLENAINLMNELKESIVTTKEVLDLETMTTSLKTTNIGDAQVRTSNPSWFEREILGKSEKFKTLNELAGGSILKADGYVDLEKLKEIYDKYGDDDRNAWMEKAIHDAEAYNKALEEVESTLEDVVGDIADDLADKFIDRWVEARDVAIDYADTLSDVAKQFAKMMIKQKLLEEVFNGKAVDDMMELANSGDIFGMQEYVANLMDTAANMGEQLRPILEILGAYMTEGEETGSVGKGIQGITEDTASLLASYINAMRSDLSAVRMMQEKGWADVSALVGYFSSTTLNDYLASCAANTADIAASNNAILLELQSVIGDPGSSGRAIRAAVSM